MTRPPRSLRTAALVLCFASCSGGEDKSDAGAALGGNEAGVTSMDASNGGGAAGGMGNDAAQAMPGGGNAGGGRNDAGGGGMMGGRNDAGGNNNVDSGGGAPGGMAGNDAGGGAGGGTCNASAAPDVGKLGLETVVTGLRQFVYAAQPPGSGDWYLVQQSGQVLVRAAGATTNTMLLDVSNEITLSMSTFAADERGLLGLAFAPDFATSGLFYVMMTPTSGNQDQVRQYRKMGSSAMLVDTLLTLPASAVNHNGGHLVMRDGLLYVGTGDGGGSCNNDKAGAPQLVSNMPNALFGKILRLDPNRKAEGYAPASGNPFSENPLIWHYGVRNPYRFSFDRANGDLYIGDVGQDGYEEVSFAKAGSSGLNFGWAAYEGTMMTCSGRTLRTGSMRTEPIFVADRRRGTNGPFSDWQSVIGGFVYRGTAIPQLVGVYLFGDYVGARMVALRRCGDATSPARELRKECSAAAPADPCFQGDGFTSLVAIVEDNAGELYFVADRTSLLKVVPGT